MRGITHSFIFPIFPSSVSSYCLVRFSLLLLSFSYSYLHISHYNLFLKCSWEGGAAAGTGSKRKSITWGDDEDDEIDEMEDPVDDEDQDEEDDYEGDGSGKEHSLFFVLCAEHSCGGV